MNELLDDNWGEEEIVIEYVKADTGVRFLAFLIDSFIFSTLGVISFFVLIIFGEALMGLLSWGVIIALILATKNGWRGLGKRVMGLQVVSINRDPTVHWGRIVVRTILKYLFVSSPFIFIFLTILAKKKRKDPQQVFFHEVMTKTKTVKIEKIDPSEES